MPEFHIKISLTKVVSINAADYQDAIDGVTEDFNRGFINTDNFDLKVEQIANIDWSQFYTDEEIIELKKKDREHIKRLPKSYFPLVYNGVVYDKNGNPIVTEEGFHTCDGLLKTTCKRADN